MAKSSLPPEKSGRNPEDNNTELDGLLNGADIPIAVLDENLKLRGCNGRARRLLHVSAGSLGRPFNDLAIPFPIPGLPELIRGTLGDNRARHCELRDNAGHWHELWVYPYRTASGLQRGVVLAFTAMDGRKKVEEILRESRHVPEAPAGQSDETEERLRQSQKMEAVGRLAGSVAHDFNNLLTIISGYAELALKRIPDGSPIQSDLQQIMAATGRATALTNHLLVFSRRQPAQPKTMDLNQFIPETEKILRRVIPEEIEMRLDLAPSPLFVNFDQGQLEQVLMNLVLNARDAMPNGGRITIETGAEREAAPPGITASGYVSFSVSDTGGGMSRETQSRLFEPFFTTKPRGKGTGLGLSTVYGIVKQHGGEISVRSAPGEGATFRVYLKKAAAQPARRPEGDPAVVEKGHGTVLLVEDEPALRQMARHILEQQGYTVLDAADGEDALGVFEKSRDAVDILLTDIVMPRMDGKELADRLKKAKPGLKIVFMSGYTNEVLEQHGISSEAGNFLQKPFTSQSLSVMLQKKLQERLKA